MKHEITLEQAQAVVNAHREAEFAAKIKATRKLVGRFFKYRNSYGTGDKWWLYAHATEVDSLGRILGLSFQHTSQDIIEIELKTSAIGIGGVITAGWEEIEPSEFWEAAAQIRTEVRHRLSKKRRTKKRLRPLKPEVR